MIEGVSITPLQQIFDERGKVMHMLRSDSSVYDEFGEIYFSCTYPGAIKAWHLHKENTLNYACVSGEVKFVLFDDRKDVSAGEKFAGSDLLGIPLRAVVSSRSIKDGGVEIKKRVEEKGRVITLDELLKTCLKNSTN